MLIELDYLQEDAYFQKMAFQYWKVDKKHHFIYKIADLSLEYQISPKKLLTYVNQSSKAHLKGFTCHLCGIPTRYLTRRSDFHQIRKAYQKWKLWGRNTPHLCNDCQQKAAKKSAKTSSKTKTKSIVKSIFTDEAYLKLFKKLKQEHYFVYPKIAFQIFIPLDKIEHLLKEEWHKSYFLNATADFLICDARGNPELLVDYQRTNQLSQIEQEELDFRKYLLESIQIPYQRLGVYD